MNTTRRLGALAGLIGAIMFAGVAVGQIPELPPTEVYLPAIIQPPTATRTSTPTPIPTATPRPATLSVSRLYIGGGATANNVYVFGMLTNETGASVQFPTVNIVLRTADGTIVNGGTSNFLYSFDKLPPNGRTPFFISLPNTPSTWSTYDLVPRWQTNSSNVISLGITQLESYFDGSGQLHLRGYVQNQSPFAVAYPEAYMVIYNAAQQVIGLGYVSLDSSQMPSASQVFFDSATTWSGYPDRSKIAGYELWAYGNSSEPAADASPIATTTAPATTPVSNEPTPLP